jgi:hypothetical protein
MWHRAGSIHFSYGLLVGQVDDRDDRLVVTSSPPWHLLEHKGVAVEIGESCVLDATSDIFDRRYVHTSAHQFRTCVFNIRNNRDGFPSPSQGLNPRRLAGRRYRY